MVKQMHQINELLDVFMDDSFELDGPSATEVVSSVAEFYKNDYRHKYHEISRYINDNYEWKKDELEFALENIKNLIMYLKISPERYDPTIQGIDSKHSSITIVRKLEKLYDHIALEEERLIKNSQIIEESKDDIRSDVMMQFEEIGDQFRKKTEDVSNSLNNNIITVVGLFSAIIFVFFGGITGMASIIKGIFEIKSKTDLRIPILVILLIGFVIFNIIFLLLYSISKIVDKNIGFVISIPEEFFYVEENENGTFDVMNIEDEVIKSFEDKERAEKYSRQTFKNFKIRRSITVFLKRLFLRFPHVILINMFFIISIIYLYKQL